MKGSLVPLVLLSVLCAISDGRSQERVRLCGQEYVRTVIYICATSRWRRQGEGAPGGHQAERRNYVQLPRRPEASEGNVARDLPAVDFSGEALARDGQTPADGQGDTGKHTLVSRRDLQTRCCVDGCSMAQLSSLC
ncbi:insulin-like peptide INSL5 [Ctenodactylus gundi]